MNYSKWSIYKLSYYIRDQQAKIFSMVELVFVRDGNRAKISGPARNQYITKFVLWFKKITAS